MRIGLIGLGRIGTYHAGNLAALDEVEQLVVTDAVPAAVASAVERFGATPAASVEALLASVDAVMITAPTNLHLGLIRQSVACRLPTFCEKPVAETLTLPVISSARSRHRVCRYRSASRAASTRRSSRPRRPSTVVSWAG